MNKRNYISIKPPCGDEIHLTEGHSSKSTLELHKRDCVKCSPPPPKPPALTRQTAHLDYSLEERSEQTYELKY
jgi:hypothetical protein